MTTKHPEAVISFAQKVRVLRKQKKLSQQEFSDLVGIDRTYASQIERAIANPSLLVILSIAKALNVHVTELLK
ncbi:MAG: helix-turn-helix domain-containing protein [Methylophilaceae bacterium]